MSWWQRLLHRPFFIRLLHWEYWSFHAVYLLIYPIWFFYCLRARSFFFFSASNPTFENGGFLMESKMKIYDLLPKEFYPKTILIMPNEEEKIIREKVRDNNFRYPLIAKPDIGGKGRGVKKIKSEDELLEYLKLFPFDMLVQEFVAFDQEVGIFYYRYPNEERGRISGIVGKHFLTVKGDGRSTIEELLNTDKRHILQLPALHDLLKNEMKIVLKDGEERLLVPYGNHARGALFVDYSHWADEKLLTAIDSICKRIPGFYFGRLDVRFDALEKLREGKDFSLIEVNGAGSEPTHMYDPKHTLFHAWREIIKHWRILHKVSRINHKNGVRYMSFKDGVKMFKDVKEYDKILDAI